ncbi:uncharacterized protein LOC135400501 [Ornithodoros turicata]|uniref:uncharacterized protein LOC135400501 n=1 Tax=Ornithodoros turicata TaxID=34597 RepID=UPI003139070B
MKFHKWASSDKSVLEFLRARIFDPLGMLAPFTIRGKAIFQELWKLKVGWDDALPAQSQVSWSHWGSELSHLQEVQLPRYYEANGVAGVRHVEIHIFCDDSPTAYGAVAYTGMEDKSLTRSSAFLIAKSRLAPLKAQTIPRLELMACLVGGRLFAYLKAKFEACPTQIHFWTDSKIALCWIQGDANRWKQFVQNRPAVVDGTKLDFVRPTPIPTSSMDRENFRKVEPEEKVSRDVIQTLTATVGEIVDMKRYSSAKKLHHVVAWVLRFVAKLKKRSEEGGPLGSEEVREAENYCLKIVQQNAFHVEIAAVQSQRPSPAKSPLQGYSLFLDGEGILRMTGRLQESDLPYAQKHPIALPKQESYSETIIRKCHLDVLHGGLRDTLVQVREKYWIVRARQAVKNKKLGRMSTIQCAGFKTNPSAAASVKGTAVGAVYSYWTRLRRTTDGEDEPINEADILRYIRMRNNEGGTPGSSAGYGHGNIFLLAFQRFVARRGIPSKVYSDNAKTFQKSNEELKKLWKIVTGEGVKEKIADWAIDWRYNVPYAPWWGGFYERLIRSVKVALKKTIGARCLNETELTTIVTEIEAVINSRPLTFVYDDQEIRPLYPAAFLTGKRLTMLPASNTGDMPESSADTIQRCWRQRAESLRAFWEKWSREYLTEDAFKNDLNEQELTDEDYQCAHDIFDLFECKDLRGYTRLYVTVEACQLCEIVLYLDG